MPDSQPSNVVKVITTDDLYNEVVGLRSDVQEVLNAHRDRPEQVRTLRADVDALLRFKWLLMGVGLASGGLGAAAVKIAGG